MTVTFILEKSPIPQAKDSFTYFGGDQVVGRGEDADWCIEDPEQFVSRKHFIISTVGADVTVTDASTGGLFVDARGEPLGIGNAVMLKQGMRLRFGEFIARVDVTTEEKATPVATRPPSGPEPDPFGFNFDAGGDEPTHKEAPRPTDLPDPFGSKPVAEANVQRKAPAPALAPLEYEDPFAFEPAPQAAQPSNAGLKFFPDDETSTTKPEEIQPEPMSLDLEPAPPGTPQTTGQPAATTVEAGQLRAAFFDGLGLDPSQFPSDDPEAQMRALGKRFRALTDGLIMLLRARAEEKNRVRVAQTIIGATNVNPLKYAVTADDGVGALLASRGQGYLDPDAALDEAFTDLADHNLRTWTAVQVALRQLIDKFDPETFEGEIEDTGLLEALLAGGRSAKLWQLYRDRYAEIAQAAEKRFLGEVGADFRDAYDGARNGPKPTGRQ